MDLTGRIVQCDDFTNGVYHVFYKQFPCAEQGSESKIYMYIF